MTALATWLEAARPKTLIASVSPVFIGTTIAIEQGKYSPSLEVAFRIAGALGTTIDQVFAYPEETK